MSSNITSGYDAQIVQQYQHRHLIHPQVAKIIKGLATNDRVLDVECRLGDVATVVASSGLRVDAIDQYPHLIKAATQQASSQHDSFLANINWIAGKVEISPSLVGPYGLVTATNTLRYANWQKIFPVIKKLITPGAYLVILEWQMQDASWQGTEKLVLENTEYLNDVFDRPSDIVDQLQQWGYFKLSGSHLTPFVPVSRKIDDYLAELYIRKGNHWRYNVYKKYHYESALRRILAPYLENGRLDYSIATQLRWGTIL